MSGNSLPVQPLTLPELRFVNWIEQHWNKYKKFPTTVIIRERWPDIDYMSVMANPTFIEALSNRGIQAPLSDGLPDELTQEQVAAVGLVLDYADKRSHNTKLRSLGITPGKWQGWLKNQVFKDYLHTLSTHSLEDALHVAHTGLISATERGDVNAIKYYMELTGRFSSDSGQTQNFKVMIQRIVESVQRHVKDPDIIRLLASDFEVIMRGEIPQTTPVLDRGAI